MPDGRSVLFTSERNGVDELFERRADGSIASELILSTEEQLNDVLVSSDGRWLVYRQATDLYARLWGEDSEPVPLVVSEFNNVAPALSPDGRWLAYTSNESGIPEVYVRPFPNTDQGKWLVSTGGGIEPVWAKDGSELFYRRANNEGQLVAVEVVSGPSFTTGDQEELFATGGFDFSFGHHQYDVSADGERFMFVGGVGVSALAEEEEVIVVENFFEELRERVGR